MDYPELGSVADMERVPHVVANFLISPLAGKVELVAPTSGVHSHHVFHRAVPIGSREEWYA